VLGYVGVQIGVVLFEEFTEAADAGTKGLVGAAADAVEAAQLAICLAAFEEVFLELLEFRVHFGAIQLAVFEFGFGGDELFDAFSHLIEGSFIGHDERCFL